MKTLSTKQKIEVLQLSDLSRPTELKAEQKGCPLTFHKQDTKIETPPPPTLFPFNSHHRD